MWFANQVPPLTDHNPEQGVAAGCQGGCCKSIKAWLNAFGHDRTSPGKPRLKAGASSPPRVRHPRRACHPMPTRKTRAQP